MNKKIDNTRDDIKKRVVVKMENELEQQDIAIKASLTKSNSSKFHAQLSSVRSSDYS